MRVEAVSAESERAWHDYVCAHPSGSVYHTLAWRRIVETGFGYRSHHVCARADDGAITGVAALFIVRGLGGRRIVAVPFRDRGGPLWSNQEAGVALFGEARALADREQARGMVIKTLEPFPPAEAAAGMLHEHRYWVHSEIDLAGQTWDSYHASLNKKVRASIREAVDAGLIGEDVTDSADAVDRWYSLHVETQRRLGIPVFPKRFFAAMRRELGANARIFVVRDGRRDVATTVVLKHRDIAMYAYSASARSAATAGDLLLATALKAAIGDGARRFDLGSDAPSQDGLLFFKRKWNARQVVIPTYLDGDAADLIQDSSSGAYGLARSVLRGMPRSLYPLTGVATRLFG